MAHFENQLTHHKIPEWSSNYIEYDKIKKMIYEVLEYRFATNQKPISENRLIRKSLKYQDLNNLKSLKTIESLDNIDLSENILSTNQHLNPSGQQISLSNSDVNSSNELDYSTMSITNEDLLVVRLHLDKEKSMAENIINVIMDNLNVIEEFTNKKNKEYNIKLQKLNQNYENSVKKNVKDINENNIIENDFFDSEERDNEKDKKLRIVRKDSSNLSNDRNDEFGFSISWQRAYSEVYNKTSWLHGFCAINKIAVYKLLSKFRKSYISSCSYKVGSYAKEHLKYLENLADKVEKHLETLKFISSVDDIGNLRLEIVKVYSEYFCDSNKDQAISKLEVRLKGGLPGEMKFISFFSGVLLTIILFSILIHFIPSNV